MNNIYSANKERFWRIEKYKENKSISRFIIKVKIIEIWIRIKDYFNIIYTDKIENCEEIFYKKLKCIWKLNLPNEIETIIYTKKQYMKKYVHNL